MKYHFFSLLAVLFLLSCSSDNNIVLERESPNQSIKVNFNLSKSGQPYYSVQFNNKVIIDTSFISFDFADSKSLKDNFNILKTTRLSYDKPWQMPWGEQLEVENTYNELVIELEETSDLKRKLNIVFKVYDDGIGFRYEFPKQDNWKEALIKEEHTEFNLTEDYKTFWIPGDWEIYEHTYKTTKLSEIDAIKYRNHPNLAQTYIPKNAVNTPVTMVGEDGLHLSFHEAALVDYSGMTLKVDKEELKLKSNLVGSKNTDYKVKRSLPFNTPWRTVQITDKATDLIASNLIINLNEPNKLGDVSWFKPMKYSGVWWELHLGKSTWNMTSGRHGANTKNVKKYIDFSAKNNIKGVLVEGWNTGWTAEEGGFDYVTPYADYDIKEVVRYGKEKDVEIIIHHETFGAVDTYTEQQDTAYAFIKSLGLHSVKSGYVTPLRPKGEFHHGQFMVEHHLNSVKKAAKYQVTINTHEPIKPTGLRRTFPNIISQEGVSGQELNIYNSAGGNPPEHLPIVAFTRMLAGPIDYTPGIFNIKLEPYKPNNQVNTTIAQQLALYVVIYSPIQMVADLVEHYEANPEPLQFIKDVGVDWSETKVLNGEVGDYVTIARKERKTGSWFVGSITDENARTIDIAFDFLEENQIYEAIIYKDGDNAHWNDNPLDILIEKIEIKKGSKLNVRLAEGGGFAISLIKK